MANVTGTSVGDFIHRAGDGRPGSGHEVTGVTTGADTISGAEGNDLVFGDDGNDSISGGSGDDILYGGQGADSLSGGVGSDVFRFEAASEINGLAEVIDGGADYDRLDFGAAFGTVNLSLATILNVEELNLSGAGNNSFTLTAAQLGAFSTVTAGFGQDILVLSAAGTADLTGAAIGGIDEIRGSAGNDVITLAGVANGQTVNGVAGNDIITGGTGIDVLNGGDGTDTVAGGGGNDVLYGGQGADSVSGGLGYDVFRFGSLIEISGLAETLNGGADDDRIDFATGNLSGAVNLSLATLIGIEELNLAGSGNTVTLTAAQLGAFSVITAGFGPDILVLSASGTADLTGAAIGGIDEIRGSAGNDTINLTDVVNGQTVNGVAGNDTIIGGAGADVLNGGDGGDAMSGGLGNDVLYGGQGADIVKGSLGYDVFRFGSLTDISGLAEVLDGGADDDRIDFATGNLSGAVNLGTATLASVEELYLAGSGNTVTLTAAQLGAFTTIVSGFGPDILVLSAAGTVDLTGASISGIDEIRGSAGNDVITLAGVGNGQTVNGRTGNDTITGGGAADVLDGGAGKDLLAGGGGADRFVLSVIGDSPATANRDVVSDFSRVEGDRIDLSRIDASTAVIGDQAFAFIGTSAFTGVAGQLRYAQSGGITIVAGDVNGDKVSDFHVEISGTVALGAIDFVL
ncbi:beta strand repeat-containing protein [Inquilinus sp.]|jgi:Ca2+-binding RTX toxin-like protein|uniref:beta strand repeat-containing protein n=1 Tax=Inquilinus sp. TaxID=1932117 RepID=UPI003784BCC3